MDKNTIKSWINLLLSHWCRAKEELEQIKKITNPQEQYEKADSAYREHNSNLGNANSYYSQLGGDISGTNWVDSSKYQNVVNELKEIKDKYEEENNKNSANIPNFNHYSECSECKKTITGQYFQKDGKKFCSQHCFDEYCLCDNCNQKIKEITGKYYQNDSSLKKRGARGLICEICYRGVCNECYQPNPENYYYHREKVDNNKFCSKDCFINHYEKELAREKKIQNHEETLAELKKLSKERKDMTNDFNKGLNDYVNEQKDNAVNGNINNSNINVMYKRERERERERESKFNLNNLNYFHKYSN